MFQHVHIHDKLFFHIFSLFFWLRKKETKKDIRRQKMDAYKKLRSTTIF